MSKVEALTRAQVIQQWPTGSDFTLTDMRTGTKFVGRGSPPRNYSHTDWQYKTKSSYDVVRAFSGRSWDGRPAVLETPSGCVSAVSYHTFNHSISVADSAYNIVSPALKRTLRLPNGSWDPATLGSGFERDKNGNWNPGSHMCMHYIDSLDAMSQTNYNRKMNAAVLEAVALAGQEQYPDSPLLVQGMMNSDDVREAQRLINGQGYRPALVVDGGFGPLTRAGVEWVQHTYGLPVTGMITLDTWRVLRAEEGQPTESEQSGTGDNPGKAFAEVTKWAKLVGLFVGDGKENYGWQRYLTREQSAALLSRFDKYLKDKK